METKWYCMCQLLPNRKKHIKYFPTEKAAMKMVGPLLRKYTDIDQYLVSLRHYSQAAADSLEAFLIYPELPEYETDLPTFDQIPGSLVIRMDELRWQDERAECPNLLVRRQTEDGEFSVDFCYYALHAPKKVSAVSITIGKQSFYSPNDYPLLVKDCLQEEPASQEQLVLRILHQYGVKMDRKSAGRHLQLLKNLGYPVQHCPEGYYREGTQQAPDLTVSYSASAYPLMVLLALDSTPKSQSQIAQLLRDTYGVTIERKAVGRHLANLQAMGYPIVKTNTGYATNR